MRLSDIIDPDLIKIPVEASSCEAAISELIHQAGANQRFENAEAVLEAVLAREQLMSTGVGNGIAIPHCKSSASPEFTLIIGIHPSGIDFQAPDKLPAKIIMLLTGPENKPGIHIRLLSRISRILAQADTRNSLQNVATAQEALDLLSTAESIFANE